MWVFPLVFNIAMTVSGVVILELLVVTDCY